MLITAFVLHRTVFNHYIYTISSNPKSTHLASVPMTHVLITMYAINKLLTTVNNMLFTSHLNTSIPTTSTNYKLNAITTCMINNTSLFSTKNNTFGTTTGALIINTLNNNSNLLTINSFYLQIIINTLILVTIAFNQ